MSYRDKYLKYKNKYLELKKMTGGGEDKSDINSKYISNLSKTALSNLGFGKAASEKAALEKAASEKAALEKAASDKLASEKAALEKAASDKLASDDLNKTVNNWYNNNRKIVLINDKSPKIPVIHNDLNYLFSYYIYMPEDKKNYMTCVNGYFVYEIRDDLPQHNYRESVEKFGYRLFMQSLYCNIAVRIIKPYDIGPLESINPNYLQTSSNLPTEFRVEKTTVVITGKDNIILPIGTSYVWHSKFEHPNAAMNGTFKEPKADKNNINRPMGAWIYIVGNPENHHYIRLLKNMT